MSQMMTPIQKIPNDIATGVGHDNSRWSLVDMEIANILIAILDIDRKQGRSIFVPMGINDKKEILLLIAKSKNPEEFVLQEFRDLATAIKDMNDLRNKVGHNSWMSGEEGELLLVSYKGGKERKRAEIGEGLKLTAEHLLALSDNMMATLMNIRLWISAHLGVQPPYFEKQAQPNPEDSHPQNETQLTRSSPPESSQA